MAKSRRRRGGIKSTVKRTVKRAPAAGGGLAKAVQNLVNALPVGELEKRLAGLEKTVARLEKSLRGAAGRAGTAVRGSRKRTAKRATKRATAKRATKRATAKRATKRVGQTETTPTAP